MELWKMRAKPEKHVRDFRCERVLKPKVGSSVFNIWKPKKFWVLTFVAQPNQMKLEIFNLIKFRD